MNERRTDFEFLRDFARHGDQSAFTELVRRHLDLVYATALRKVEDQGGAEEVAQNVFVILARKSWQFARDDSVLAWLYKTTLLEAKDWWRRELRRRRREETAAELGTTMKTSDEQSAFQALVPLLDEALQSLREEDRAALLLRFHERRSLREVGASLGLKEDAAQKRVAGAVERLAQFFRRRGFKTASVAAAAAALEHTAASAPAALLPSVVQSTIPAATALSGLVGWLSRCASLTKLQTVAACLVLCIPPVLWQRHHTHTALRRAAAIHEYLNQAKVRQEHLVTEIAGFRAESARLDSALAEAKREQAREAGAWRKLQVLKVRLYGLLTNANYRWPDDLPCVRIPKSVIKEIYPRGATFAHSGKMTEPAIELLQITPDEEHPIESALGNYWGGVEAMMGSSAYETNVPETQPGRVVKEVIVPPLGQELKMLAEDTARQLANQLGSDRENILFGGWDQGAIQLCWPGNLWNISMAPQTFTMWVNLNGAGTNGPSYGSSWTSKWGGISTEGPFSVGLLPQPIAARFFEPWLRQLGINDYKLSSSE